MASLHSLLASLLFVLTFNAYACLLPLQAQSGMDCSSTTEQPVRRICDAFTELGPQSQTSFAQELPTVRVAFEPVTQLAPLVFLVVRREHAPRDADTSIHLSIPTTVLRI
jgi:hypothetical protein